MARKEGGRYPLHDLKSGSQLMRDSRHVSAHAFGYDRPMPDLVRIPASVFPRDSDGFLSRECPVCERTFKVKFDENAESAGQELSDEEASVEAGQMRRFCPLCHEFVEGSKWWTPAQLEYTEALVFGAVHEQFQQMLADTARSSGGVLEFRASRPPSEPMPSEESEDMIIVVPPCHEDDSVKVPGDFVGEVACHRCGVRYLIDVIRA
jgi:hypothetical protein